jgi:hypothetical protein
MTRHATSSIECSAFFNVYAQRIDVTMYRGFFAKNQHATNVGIAVKGAFYICITTD